MEVKGNKEERDKLLGPRGEEFRWGSYRRRELGDKKNCHFRLRKEDIAKAPRRAVCSL